MTEQQNPRREPVWVDRNDVVQTSHNPYLLHYHEFQSLTKIHSFLAIWAHSLFAGTGIFLVTIVARLVEKHLFGGSSNVSALEWITFGILVVLVLIFEGLILLVPSERKKTAQKIQKHFDRYEA
jgi:hypothetical protein